MIIRRYGTQPTTYTADVGEIVYARRSTSDPWAKAVVLMVRKRRHRVIRYELMWLETQEHTSAKEGEYSHVYQDPKGPWLLKQMPVKRAA